MSPLAAACDVAQAVASTCVHASPGAPTVAQWSHQNSQAFKDLVGSYLGLGPLFWLALLAVLWLTGKALSFVALLIVGPGKDPK